MASGAVGDCPVTLGLWRGQFSLRGGRVSAAPWAAWRDAQYLSVGLSPMNDTRWLLVCQSTRIGLCYQGSGNWSNELFLLGWRPLEHTGTGFV